jgi:hypothetical protein
MFYIRETQWQSMPAGAPNLDFFFDYLSRPSQVCFSSACISWPAQVEANQGMYCISSTALHTQENANLMINPEFSKFHLEVMQ